MITLYRCLKEPLSPFELFHVFAPDHLQNILLGSSKKITCLQFNPNL